jgi:uncharacterized membrane protein
MDKQDLNLLINIFRFVFELYKNPKQVKSFLTSIFNLIPLLLAISMIFTSVLSFVLSPLAFRTQAVNGLDYAYGSFFIFIAMAVISVFIAQFFYKEFKNPITF